MRLLVLLSVIIFVNGTPLKPGAGPPPPPGTAADKLEAFPWIKASKAKARFGPTTHAPPTTGAPPSSGDEPEIQPVLTKEMLQSYIAALTAQLQPYVINEGGPVGAVTTAPAPAQPDIPPQLPLKKSWKSKVPKAVDPKEEPQPVTAATTPVYWMEERKMYPDTFYDEFFMDWLRKRRQVEEIEVATPAPAISDEEPEPVPVSAPAPAPQPVVPYPTVPMQMSPYMVSPYMYPLAGFKLTKAMAQAQVSAALAAFNITTTQKPVKIKLKIPIPAGDDLAQVVASGIAGFPAGTTYELSRKK